MRRREYVLPTPAEKPERASEVFLDIIGMEMFDHLSGHDRVVSLSLFEFCEMNTIRLMPNDGIEFAISPFERHFRRNTRPAVVGEVPGETAIT